ncbi:PTS galactosamine/N-acetylgalactosamine transporter subunit IIA [Clostridium beijerinckii]|uniref:PTS galactosamine/N-acetylgalactosamine transporter subunit IIA n=1 Tax=Clostridium beijerinckii TaxID=1520 RepID=UPI0002F606C3|nr:PTS galactosamine/N-acetylgalactosamine transporter subunit IIA [Clostridium beijerinckii]
MIGIIVSGHGNFASGLLSTVKLIAGEQDMVIGIDFVDGQGSVELKNNIKDAMNKLGDEILVLTDLAGGSPFMNSVLLKQELTDKKIEVISGTNIPMLLEVVLKRDDNDMKELMQLAKMAGTNGINIFELKEKQEEDYNSDDGI